MLGRALRCWLVLASVLTTGSPGQSSDQSSWTVHGFHLSSTPGQSGIEPALSGLREAFGFTLEVAPELAAKDLQIYVQKVDWRTAVDAICDSLDCRWQLEESDGSAVLSLTPRTAEASTIDHEAVSPLDKKIRLTLDGPSAEQLKVLANLAGLELDGYRPFGRIYSVLHDVRIATAFDVICDQAGCDWSRDDHRLRITPDSPLRQPEERLKAGLRIVVAEGAKVSKLPATEVLFHIGQAAQLDIVNVTELPQRMLETPLAGSGERLLDLVAERTNCAWRLVEPSYIAWTCPS